MKNRLLLVFIFSFQCAWAQTDLQKAEEIFKLINTYRIKKKLPAVPKSTKLTFVATTHAKDLMTNPPSGVCNMHSWSSKGSWEACCYTADHKNPECMWSKPKELAQYQAHGFEIAHWTSDGVDAVKAVEGWKSSSGHNQVMVNLGIWKDIEWKAMGVGVNGNFAVVWFGQMEDKP